MVWVLGFTTLPVLPGGLYGGAYGVSADGTTPVGYVSPVGTTIPGDHHQACYWTDTSGPIVIGADYSEAVGVSGDGSVIVGNTFTNPFIWTAGGGYVSFAGPDDTVLAISADGTRLVGAASADGGAHFQACYWNRSFTRTDIGFLPGHNSSTALAVSADGTYIVGFSQDTTTFNTQRAFRWTASGGMQNLGLIGGTALHSVGTGVSDDGATVSVNQAAVANPADGAARWTLSGGLALLPSVSPDIISNNFATGISADGSAIIGTSDYVIAGVGQNYECLAWWVDGVITVIPAIDLDPGDSEDARSLTDATGVSRNGSVIVGYTHSLDYLPWVYVRAVSSATTLIDAELILQPGTAFVDFTTEATRRLFVSTGGTPQWVGPTGSIPFNGTPAVYLTTQGAPVDFAQNNGRSGSFVPSGTVGPASGPGCTPYYVTEAAGPAANPQWRLSLSDDGGRTWSTLVKPRDIGQLGHYLQRLRWLKMGQSRQRMVRLECTDPVRRNIVGIYIDAGQGMS